MKLSSCKLTQQSLQAELYLSYNDNNVSLQQFRDLCKNMIMSARAPNHQIIRQLNTMSRDKALMTTNNFILKGHGLGVM